jgi:hypothetical protein
MLALVDRKGQRLFHKKVDCDLNRVEQALSPYRKRIDTIAVESTFNWYWLVDGLQEPKSSRNRAFKNSPDCALEPLPRYG